MNSPNYNYPPFSSPPFRGPMSSTPTGNRPPRPRFGFAGPPSYPRPRSSASKPNPGSYYNEDSFSTPNTSQNSNYNSFEDSIRNNYGSPGPCGGDSFNAGLDSSYQNNDDYFDAEQDNSVFSNDGYFNAEQNSSLCNNDGSFDTSGPYYSCNDTFTESPQQNVNIQNRFPSPLQTMNIRSRFPPPQQQNFSNYSTQSKRGFVRIPRPANPRFPVKNNNQFTPRNPGSFSGQFNVQNRPFAHRPSFKLQKRQMEQKFRCDVCDVTLNSQSVYQMHIQGAKHAKRLKTNELAVGAKEQTLENTYVTKLGLTAYRCDLCMVVVNSFAQMTTHIDGTKHKSKVQQAQQQPTGDPEQEDKKEAISTATTAATSTDTTEATSTDTTEATKANSTEENGSNKSPGVRTLPADFDDSQPTKKLKNYCEVCNVSVNSAVQMQQHLTSKKHEAKVLGKPLVKNSGKRRPGFGAKKGGGVSVSVSAGTAVSGPPTVVGVKTLASSFVAGETMK